MKKRIFAGLLLAFMLIMSAIPVLAEPAATEEAPAADNASNAAALTLPQIAEADNFEITETTYDNKAKTLSFTVTNKSEDIATLGLLGLEYNTEEISIPLSSQQIMGPEIMSYYGVEFTDGVIIYIVKDLEPEKSIPVKINADIKNYNKDKLPEISAKILLNTMSTGVDYTASAVANPEELKLQTIKNIFNPGGVQAEAVEKTPTQAITNFVEQTGFSMLVKGISTNWKLIVMILISLVLMYLAIVKKFEPLLLLPIAFGMLLTNLPGIGVFHEELFAGGHVHWDAFSGTGEISPGLIDYLYLGVKLGIYPCLIFFGVGAMTDFGPLIANPKSLLLGAAAQLGIFITYIVCFEGFDFTAMQAASTGIIGGADGPTAIFVTSKLAPELLGPIAVAAYSYMALVPVIQPPIMKALTTKKERQIVMKPLREVSKTEKIVFPIVVTIFVSLLVPSAGPLVGSLMLGNLVKECGVTERLSKTMQNELMNIVTIFLGISVGATATASTFLAPKTLIIVCVGVVAFGVGSAGGVLLAKFMNLFTKNKINPLMGSAGVSAVPMAARVSQTVGQQENPQNFLLMHAMGPNVAGVIGSAIAAGVLIALFG